ncbi:MAG: glycosyltransferase family 4 protein [Ignavibacteria bacterium]|nr:glycosyltransferase family 4 protein [Ignavibacteria bacterium]
MKLAFIGRYNDTEFLTGPEKVAKRIFTEHAREYDSVFIEYFFDGKKHGIFKKFFGSEKVTKVINSEVMRFGIVSMIFFLCKYKPDIIHIITYERFSAAVFLYKIFSNVKVVYTVHGIAVHENDKYNITDKTYRIKDKLTEKRIFKNSDRLLFLSVQSLLIAKDYFQIDEDKVRIVPNGIDEVFHTAGKNIKHPYSVINIFFSGNPDRKEKGFGFVKDVFSELRFPFRLYLIDSKTEFHEDYIIPKKFTGTDQFSKLMSKMDVVVSASIYEPFSMTATEAMAAGAVPVVSEDTGMSRYISEGVNGFVFKITDSAVLKNILNELYSDRKKLSEISVNAGKIFEVLNWKNVYIMYNNIYSELTAGKNA